MIIRQWSGLAKKESEASYVAHFREEVLPKLRRIPGFRGATLLRQEQKDFVEITVHTRWQSMGAIEEFTGKDVSVAVVAPAARSWFISFDRSVSHLDVIHEERG
jgi:heme-degrading monooxygenase HmoA